MRIAFCGVKNVAYGGGIEKYTLELGSRLVARGHHVTVYCMPHYGQVPATTNGMVIKAVPCLRLGIAEKATASAASAVKTILDGRFDVVHFHHIASGWAAWLCKYAGIKCVLQSHGIAWRCSKWGGFGPKVLRVMERLAVHGCDALTGVSKAQAEYYYRKYGKKMIYIPSGVAAEKPVASQEIYGLGLAPNSYILFMGRLSPEKGVHFLIRAFRQIQPSHKLVIAGAACNLNYQRRLFQLAEGDGRIIFAGEVSGRLHAELFSNAYMYVQPSELEGLSIALLEAMSYGNCCLVSDIAENIEAIDDAGLHFKNGSVQSLRGHLAWLLSHPEAARRLGDQARRRVGRNYCWDNITSAFERLYEEVTRSKSSLMPGRPLLKGQNAHEVFRPRLCTTQRQVRRKAS